MSNNRGKSLVKNTIIITIGTICTKMITFLLLPLYTNILNTEEYGIVDLLTTLISLLLPIITFQIEQAVFRELIEVRDSKKSKKTIISSGFFTVVFQSGIYLLCFLSISPIIQNDYKIFLITNVIANIILSLFLQILRGLGDNKKYAIVSFLDAFFIIVCNIIFLLFFRLRVTGMLLGNLIGHIICIIIIIISSKMYQYISFKFFNKNIVKKLLMYSLPLVPNAISWWIFSSSDRVIVSMFLGLSMNGILSAASKFSGIYINVYNIFNMSWTESIALHINDEDISDYFNKMFLSIFKLFFSFCLIFISIMPFLYKVMVNKEYIYGLDIVPILLVGSLFNVIIGLISVIYVAKKNTKAIASTSIISAVLNIVIHLSLIGAIGIYAAAISTAAAYFIMCIYRLYDIDKKYIKIHIEKKILLVMTVSLITCIYMFYIDNIYFNVTNIVLSLIASVYLNKKSMKEVMHIIKGKIGKVIL